MILNSYNAKTKKSKWSDDERRKLMKLAGTMTIEDLAKALGRGITAVKGQCHRQGVKYGFLKSRVDA